MSVDGITEFCFRDGIVPCALKPVTDRMGVATGAEALAKANTAVALAVSK